MGFIDDAIDFVTKPARDLHRAAARTVAGSFDDLTEPFLKPLDRLLDVLSPRVRFDARLDAAVSGSTSHQIVFPQLPGLPIGSGGGASLGDVTGGLLSDLAFNSEELRRVETELKFLESAMRRGVYPHRDDVFVLGYSVVPKENYKGNTWIRVRVSGEGDTTLAVATMRLLESEVQAQVANAKLRQGSAQRGIDSEAMAAALERSDRLQLATEPGQRRKIRIDLTAHGDKGAADNGAFAQLQEITVWVERRNEGYTDLLHLFECREPAAPLRLQFPIDRIPYISKGKDHQMNAVDRQGGHLTVAADEIEQARKVLAGPLQAPPADLPGAARLAELLARRVARAEGTREKLWQARRKLGRLQAAQNRFDYRLRYKLRLDNASSNARNVARLHVKSSSAKNQGAVTSDWELSDFDLPRYSRYEVTVYPLQKHGDDESEATVTLSDPSQHVTFALLGGLGLSHWVLRSVLVKSQGGQSDSGELRWTVADCASPPVTDGPALTGAGAQPAELTLA